jgi:hypothetical protein
VKRIAGDKLTLTITNLTKASNPSNYRAFIRAHLKLLYKFAKVKKDKQCKKVSSLRP